MCSSLYNDGLRGCCVQHMVQSPLAPAYASAARLAPSFASQYPQAASLEELQQTAAGQSSLVTGGASLVTSPSPADQQFRAEQQALFKSDQQAGMTHTEVGDQQSVSIMLYTVACCKQYASRKLRQCMTCYILVLVFIIK